MKIKVFRAVIKPKATFDSGVTKIESEINQFVKGKVVIDIKQSLTKTDEHFFLLVYTVLYE